MRSIAHISVENFQSHKHSVIELPGPGTLTVVTGPSDSGKTALVSRALRWALLNQPQGDAFIRQGATYAKVTVKFDDGWWVERERTPSRNQYRICAPDSVQAQVFEGFGSSVPLEVQQVTGVAPVRIGDLDLTLNLSSQLESAFLGSSISSTARARVLGVLAGTEAIDHAAKGVATDLHRARRDETRIESELKGIEERVSRLAWVEPMGALLDETANVVDKFKSATARREELEQLLLKRHGLRGRVGQCRDRIEVCERMLRAKKPVELACELRQRYAAVLSLIARRDGVQSLIAKQLTAQVQNEAILRARPHVSGAQEYAARYDRLRTLTNNRRRVKSSIWTAAQTGLHATAILNRPKDIVNRDLRPALDKYAQVRRLAYQRRALLESIFEERLRVGETAGKVAAAILAREAYLTALGRCPTCGQTISVSA